MRKVIETIGGVLVTFGLLLLLGSFLAWGIGPEEVAAIYERGKPVLPYLLTGIGLLVIGILMTSVFGQKASAPAAEAVAAPDGASTGPTRCGACEAPYDDHSKFCAQCGASLMRPQPSGTRDLPETGIRT